MPDLIDAAPRAATASETPQELVAVFHRAYCVGGTAHAMPPCGERADAFWRDAAPRDATEPPDEDVETVVRYSSPFRNCQYAAAFRAPCPEVAPARPESWCPFCQAHTRLTQAHARLAATSAPEPVPASLPSEMDIAAALQGVDPGDLKLGHDLRKPAAVILANLKRATAHKAAKGDTLVVYLAHPLGGDWEGNIASARVYAERAVRILGVCPVAPYLTLYGLLHEPADRLIGIGLDAAIIPKCDELWLCGPRVSPGMELERDQALKLGIPVRRWTAPDAELRDL